MKSSTYIFVRLDRVKILPMQISGSRHTVFLRYINVPPMIMSPWSIMRYLFREQQHLNILCISANLQAIFHYRQWLVKSPLASGPLFVWRGWTLLDWPESLWQFFSENHDDIARAIIWVIGLGNISEGILFQMFREVLGRFNDKSNGRSPTPGAFWQSIITSGKDVFKQMTARRTRVICCVTRQDFKCITKLKISDATRVKLLWITHLKVRVSVHLRTTLLVGRL